MQSQAKLDELPFEILGQITTSLDHARSVWSLCLTCRHLNRFVAKEGWYAFVNSHFPGYNGPPLWRDAAHSLTSLSKSWDKRAINAKFILPSNNVHVRHIRSRDRQQSNGDTRISYQEAGSESTNARPPPRERNRRPVGQTMGYHPVHDCTERWIGGSWTDREELLVVGAGAEVLVRNRCIARTKQDDIHTSMDSLALKENITFATDDHGRKSYWRSWKSAGLKDGPDDISTLKILDRNAEHADDLLVGRTNGELQQVRVGDDVSILKNFVTQSQSVHCMDYTGANQDLLAVALGSKDIALYHLQDERDQVAPLQVFSRLSPERSARTRSTRFLGPSCLAIGHGISRKPLEVYEIRPDGVSEQPLRCFPALREKMYGQTASSSTNEPSDAVYSISTLPEGALASGNGQIFVSGWYSGAIRLHDMRSSEPAVMTFADPLEAGASVYSVLSMGMDRIVAGTALHAKMQVYEIRSHQRPRDYVAPGIPKPTTGRTGYSLFLARDYKSARKESSVYSLAMSSPYSSTIYAGLQGSIMEMDLFESMDKSPDPIYTASLDRMSQSKRFERNYASLAMMDHIGSHQLLIQRDFQGRTASRWDNRWGVLV